MEIQKMTPRIIALLVVGVLQLSSWMASAESDPSTLVSASECVAIVRILGVDSPKIGQPTPHLAVSVMHTLKGCQTIGSLRLALPAATYPTAPRILIGENYLVFLNRLQGAKDWAVESPVGIARIDAAFVESFTKSTVSDVMGILERSLGSSNVEVQEDVLRILSEIEYFPASFSRARQLSASRSEVVAARALIYRIKKGDEVDTDHVVSFVEHSSELSERDRRELAFCAVYDAPLSVAERNKLLSGSSSADIRNVAAAALHFRGDETSIPVLLEAVSSEDPLIAVHAHEGLKRITGRDAPVLSEFKASVTDVREDWKRWVKEWAEADADHRE